MRYLALGDSFTIGTGTTPDLSFPAMLARRWRERDIECDLRNPAVNGFTTDDLIREELPLLETYAPDLVTVLIGANDIVAGSSEGRYRAQLRRIHERITAVVPRARRYALPQPDWSVAPASVAFGDPADVARTIERFNEIAREEAMRAGGTYVDPVLAGTLAASSIGNKLPELTQRERDVLRLLADGLANEEIGKRLFISAETVRTHVRKAMDKLDADTRTQAVARALRDHLIA